MQYLILLLLLGAAIEYLRRERAHRRALDYVRVHRTGLLTAAAPSGLRRFFARSLAALLVLALSIALATGLGPVHPPDAIFRALGIALLPVAAVLALMARREIPPHPSAQRGE